MSETENNASSVQPNQTVQPTSPSTQTTAQGGSEPKRSKKPKTDYSRLDSLTLDELKAERNKARALSTQITKRINQRLLDAGEATDDQYITLALFDEVMGRVFPLYTWEMIQPEQAMRINGWFKKLKVTDAKLQLLVMYLRHDAYFRMSPTRQRVLSRLEHHLAQADALAKAYVPENNR